jgi:hypothetical protein
MEREEVEDTTGKLMTKFVLNGQRQEVFQAYEIVHFRLLTDMGYLPYGRSILESSRKIWKHLKMMEDAMLIYRITRAPERRLFFIDVGNLNPNDVESYLQKVVSKLKKAPIVDAATGEINLRYNLENITEDYVFPTRGQNEGTRVDTLPGGSNTDAIDDIEYLRDQLFSAWKVPKSFLGFEEELGAKSTLALEDIRFARSIMKIQRIVETELTKMAVIHLYALGYEDEDLVNFELKLTNPSTIAEQQKLELMEQRLNVGSSAKDADLFSSEWIYKNIFTLSDDEIEDIKNGQVEDKKFTHRLTQIEEEGNDPAVSKRTIDSDGGGEEDGGDEERELGFSFDDEEGVETPGDDRSEMQKISDDLNASKKGEKVGKRTLGYKPSITAGRQPRKRHARILTEGADATEEYVAGIQKLVNGLEEKFAKKKQVDKEK